MFLEYMRQVPLQYPKYNRENGQSTYAYHSPFTLLLLAYRPAATTNNSGQPASTPTPAAVTIAIAATASGFVNFESFGLEGLSDFLGLWHDISTPSASNLTLGVLLSA